MSTNNHRLRSIILDVRAPTTSTGGSSFISSVELLAATRRTLVDELRALFGVAFLRNVDPIDASQHTFTSLHCLSSKTLATMLPPTRVATSTSSPFTTNGGLPVFQDFLDSLKKIEEWPVEPCLAPWMNASNPDGSATSGAAAAEEDVKVKQQRHAHVAAIRALLEHALVKPAGSTKMTATATPATASGNHPSSFKDVEVILVSCYAQNLTGVSIPVVSDLTSANVTLVHVSSTAAVSATQSTTGPHLRIHRVCAHQRVLRAVLHNVFAEALDLVPTHGVLLTLAPSGNGVVTTNESSSLQCQARPHHLLPSAFSLSSPDCSHSPEDLAAGGGVWKDAGSTCPKLVQQYTVLNVVGRAVLSDLDEATLAGSPFRITPTDEAAYGFQLLCDGLNRRHEALIVTFDSVAMDFCSSVLGSVSQLLCIVGISNLRFLAMPSGPDAEGVNFLLRAICPPEMVTAFPPTSHHTRRAVAASAAMEAKADMQLNALPRLFQPSTSVSPFGTGGHELANGTTSVETSDDGSRLNGIPTQRWELIARRIGTPASGKLFLKELFLSSHHASTASTGPKRTLVRGKTGARGIIPLAHTSTDPDAAAMDSTSCNDPSDLEDAPPRQTRRVTFAQHATSGNRHF